MRYTIKNLLPGTATWDGWSISGGAVTNDRSEREALALRLTGTSGNWSAGASVPLPALAPEHRYYFRAKGLQTRASIASSQLVIFSQPVTAAMYLQDIGDARVYSATGSTGASTAPDDITIMFVNRYAAGELFLFAPVLIDLTDIFGRGYEPDLAWCDEHIPFVIDEAELWTESGLELDLITDRTREDVERVRAVLLALRDGTATAQEREAFLAPMKGAYNYVDLNRVGNAIYFVSVWLDTLCGVCAGVDPKRDWRETDIPSADDAERYLLNVEAIRAALPAAAPPAPVDMDALTWQEANQIERILDIVRELILRIIAAWTYSGELFAGET